MEPKKEQVVELEKGLIVESEKGQIVEPEKRLILEVDKEPIVDLEKEQIVVPDKEQVLEPVEELIMDSPMREPTQQIIKDLIQELGTEADSVDFIADYINDMNFIAHEEIMHLMTLVRPPMFTTDKCLLNLEM